jgi:hypothetical protein
MFYSSPDHNEVYNTSLEKKVPILKLESEGEESEGGDL